MTDEKIIRTAFECLDKNQGIEIGRLYLAPLDKEITVVGQTQYNDPDSLNKSIAKIELEAIKAELNDFRFIDSEFDQYFQDKKIKYCLAYTYGMGGIELCNELNGKLTWSYDIKD